MIPTKIILICTSTKKPIHSYFTHNIPRVGDEVRFMPENKKYAILVHITHIVHCVDEASETHERVNCLCTIIKMVDSQTSKH